METRMHCFGLNDVACAWMLDLERKLEQALTFLARFGLTGSAIAVGLTLTYLGTRRLAQMLGMKMHVSRLRQSAAHLLRDRLRARVPAPIRRRADATLAHMGAAMLRPC